MDSQWNIYMFKTSTNILTPIRLNTGKLTLIKYYLFSDLYVFFCRVTTIKYNTKQTKKYYFNTTLASSK